SNTREEAITYENELKTKLGPRYKDLLNQILEKLSSFEDYQVDILDSNPNYVNRNIATNNIWEFNKNYKADRLNEIIRFEFQDNTYGVYFTGFRDLMYIPKEEVAKVINTDFGPSIVLENSGFYTDSFNEIKNNPDKLAYWELIKDISEYI